VAIYGGANIVSQIKQVAAGAQIVVATPGRCSICSSGKKVNVSAINWLVLDEADEMLDMGFKEDLNAILSGTPVQKRVLLVSATMPRGIESDCRKLYEKSQGNNGGLQKQGEPKIFRINIMSCMPKTGI